MVGHSVVRRTVPAKSSQPGHSNKGSDPHIGTILGTETLGPPQQSPKYVRWRVFRDDVKPENVRTLIDGFPRDADHRKVAHDRLVSRERAMDVFEKRFDEHVEKIGPTLAAMRNDGITIVGAGNDELEAEAIIQQPEENEAWVTVVTAGAATSRVQ
ncbi:hypothetical protein EJ02DRAFT_431772 [Clathrospora elynae]|uniref:Uncharacterized protein n=1 Tax=Clathrospora elynae TaxID=706981 RepID=A0A6A5T352_9PLEO|nr:hypothetical protein EJ02DRAFT_431772 [Clathrospora elynae]